MNYICHLVRPLNIISIVLLFTISFGAYAQKRNGTKSTYTRERFNHNATRVRGSKAKTVCPIFEPSKYPYHGFGIKLGDPFAFTYKFYPNKRFALVADLGKVASGLYNTYYRSKFDDYTQSDTLSDNASITLITHDVKADNIAELKLLYQIDASKISPGLQFYIGGGWEWKRTRLEYDYFYDQQPTAQNPEPETSLNKYTVTRFTQGPQGIIGIEYSYFNFPLSAFMELEYFVDAQLDPGARKVEGGVGLRYIF